jgi:hypothetical protein
MSGHYFTEMTKRKKPRKPTGHAGSIVVSSLPQASGFERVEFPGGKDELERYIFGGARRTATRVGMDPYRLLGEPVQNPENDFDFTLPTAYGREFLDLVEFAPITGAGGYAGAPLSYTVDGLGDEVISAIRAKAEHYGTGMAGLQLLVFSTDFRYRPEQPVLDWVSCWCVDTQHPFKTIHYYFPEEGQTGVLTLVFPRAVEEISRIDRNLLRGGQVALVDFSEPEISADGSVSMKLGTIPKPGPGQTIAITVRVARGS